MSPGVLAELRRLRPNRWLTENEARRVAEQQAARLIYLAGFSNVGDAPIREDLIATLPRFLVRRYPLGNSISGLAHWDRGRWCIALNSKEPLVRQRFSLAHELGHILEAPFQRYARPESVERLADHFAANLLMPRPWVKQLWGKGVQDPHELAQHFDVSEAAMSRRLRELRINDSDEPGVRPEPPRTPYLRLAGSLKGGHREPISH